MKCSNSKNTIFDGLMEDWLRQKWVSIYKD